MIEKRYDKIQLKIFPDRLQMGASAACDAAERMRALLQEEEEINCIFAAAPSQTEFLAELCRQPNIDWKRVNAYHMDEYVGLPFGHEKSFGSFLSRAIFDKVPFKSVNLINGSLPPDEEAERYAEILCKAPTHITFMGIGENGHVAFNDPPVADFHDPRVVKTVALDPVCRMQQVHDGCFESLQQVPKYALTVTIPRLVASRYIFCIVPTAQKHRAVFETLTGPVCTDCPASILRHTDHVQMYIDSDCAGSLANEPEKEALLR